MTVPSNGCGGDDAAAAAAVVAVVDVAAPVILFLLIFLFLIRLVGSEMCIRDSRYTVATRMTPALRWAAMRAILMFQ